MTVPSGQITAAVSSSEKLNTNSAILVDLSPSIVSIYTSNSTTFILVPSVRAVVVGRSGVSVEVGHRQDLDCKHGARAHGKQHAGCHNGRLSGL